MKRFKSKKKNNMFMICIIFFSISVIFTIIFLSKAKLINNNTIIKYLISDLDNSKTKLNDMDFLLKYALNVKFEENKPVSKTEDETGNKVEINNKEEDKQEEVQELSKIVYIYNTHQEEKYKSNYLEAYNITPNVLIASKILKEYLEALGIGVIVEEENVTKKLHSLNLNYSGSYKVTRIFMEEAKKKNPTLKYFIDLHRDSSNYDKTTTTINNEKYAKVLFLVGLENPNYEKNLKLAEKLKEKVIAFDSSLSRGILKKSGPGVNGVYNQDFDERTMLIEVGGQYNYINEVDNTLKVIAKIIKEYIEEDQNE